MKCAEEYPGPMGEVMKYAEEYPGPRGRLRSVQRSIPGEVMKCAEEYPGPRGEVMKCAEEYPGRGYEVCRGLSRAQRGGYEADLAVFNIMTREENKL